MSIDEMIASGKTLPEIQAELRRVVARRDENDLKQKKIEATRAQFIDAMIKWWDALGLSSLDDRDKAVIEKMVCEVECEVQKNLRRLDSNPFEASVIAKPATSNEDYIDWLKEFAKSLSI